MVAQIIAGTKGGLGRHYDVLTKEEWYMYLEMSFVQEIVMTVTSICFLKISIALSLLRLNSRPIYRKTLWGLISRSMI